MFMLFMNSHSSVFYPLSVNYMGLGDKELLAMSMKSLGEPYSLVPFGPDHVGVRTDQGTYGNTMLQYAPDGKVMFLHTNLGKLTTAFPTNRDNYVRRWQTSRVHGSKVRDLIADASGTDLEFWMLDTLESFRCKCRATKGHGTKCGDSCPCRKAGRPCSSLCHRGGTCCNWTLPEVNEIENRNVTA